jgi:hypothetical protein
MIQVITEELGMKLESVEPLMLGSCKKVLNFLVIIYSMRPNFDWNLQTVTFLILTSSFSAMLVSLFFICIL